MTLSALLLSLTAGFTSSLTDFEIDMDAEGALSVGVISEMVFESVGEDDWGGGWVFEGIEES